MKIGHVELLVKDPVKSRNYYVDVLGFKLDADQGPNYQWVQLGENLILLKKGSAPQKKFEESNNIVVYTDNLPNSVKQLSSKGVTFHQIQNCYHFQDLDGHWFQLVNPHDDHSE